MRTLYKIDRRFESRGRQYAVDALTRLMTMREVTAAYVREAIKLGAKFNSNNRLDSMRHDMKELRQRFKNGLMVYHDDALMRTVNGYSFRSTIPSDKPRVMALKIAKESLIRQIKEYRRMSKVLYDTKGAKILRRKPGQFMMEILVRRLRDPKTPVTNDQYIGIEIECVMPRTADFTALAPFHKYVAVGTDGSVNYESGEEGREIRVCLKRSEVRDILPKILDTLRNLGAYVNTSCGLHVHLDQRNNPRPDIAFNNLVRSLSLLYKVVPASRHKNGYCHRNRTANWNDARYQERYKAVNATAYDRYRTLEVRLFGGTLNATKIINWVETLEGIVDMPEMMMRCPGTFKLAQKKWKLSDENVAWLEMREKMFSDINVSRTEADLNGDVNVPIAVNQFETVPF